MTPSQAATFDSFAPANHVIDAAAADELDLADILERVRQEKWAIVKFGLLLALLAIAYCLVATPVYKAEALLRIETASEVDATGTTTETEIEIIRSWSVINEVVDKLGGPVDIIYPPAWQEGLRSLATFWRKPPEQMPGMILKLEQLVVPDSWNNQSLALEVLPEGRFRLYGPYHEKLLEGSDSDDAPAETVDTQPGAPKVRIKLKQLNASPGTIITLIPRNREEYIANIQARLHVERRGVVGRSDVVEAAFSDHQPAFAQNFLAMLIDSYLGRAYDRKSQGIMKSLAYLEAQLEQTQKEIEEAEKRLKEFQQAENYVSLSYESELTLKRLVGIQAKMLDIRVKQREMDQFYTNQHPEQRVQHEQIAYLKAEMEPLEKRIDELPVLERQLLMLKRDVDMYNRLYIYNNEKLNQLRIEVAGVIGYARVIDPAKVKPGRVSPKTTQLVLLGFALGVLLATMAVILRNSWLFLTAQDTRQLRRTLSLPILAEVPSALGGNEGAGRKITVIRDAANPAYAVLSRLAENLDFILARAENNIILFTGDTPHQGKSMIAATFATLCAQQRSVLLVDACLASPVLHTTFQQSLTPGLSGVIIGKQSIKDCIKPVAAGKLSVLPAGAAPPNEEALLGHPKFALLLSELAKQYDVVVVDYPDLEHATANPQDINFASTRLLVLGFGENLLRLKRFITRFTARGGSLQGIILNNVPETAKPWWRLW